MNQIAFPGWDDEPEGWQPYADGTSGHQGEASEAGEQDRRSKLAPAHEFVRRAGRRGITSAELRDRTGWHHGQASGALSNLDRSRLIVRLKERRNRYGVYVTPDNLHGRETVPHRSNRKKGADMPAAQITITGNLTRDPEVRTTQNGKILCRLSVACDENRKNLDGTWDEINTSFYDVTVWDRLGERCADTLHKGQGVHIVGKLVINEDKGDTDSGPRQKYVNVTAHNVFAAIQGRKEAPKPDYEGEPPW